MAQAPKKRTRAEEEAYLQLLKYNRYNVKSQNKIDEGNKAPVPPPRPGEPTFNPVRNREPNYQGFAGILNMVTDALAGNYNKKGNRGEKPK